MRKNVVLLAIPLCLLFLLGCDIKTPEQMRAAVHQALNPYFPRVQVLVLPQQELLVGLSCVEDIGPKLIQDVAATVRANPQIRQLRTLRNLGPIFGSSTYKYFGVGFANSIVRYDVDTDQVEILNVDRNYTQSYRNLCGATNPSGAASTYTWIGVFQVEDASKQVQTVQDALGVYSLSDFETYRAEEVSAREAIIRKVFADQGKTVLSLRLLQIYKVPFSESALNSTTLAYEAK